MGSVGNLHPTNAEAVKQEVPEPSRSSKDPDRQAQIHEFRV